MKNFFKNSAPQNFRKIFFQNRPDDFFESDFNFPERNDKNDKTTFAGFEDRINELFSKGNRNPVAIFNLKTDFLKFLNAQSSRGNFSENSKITTFNDTSVTFQNPDGKKFTINIDFENQKISESENIDDGENPLENFDFGN